MSRRHVVVDGMATIAAAAAAATGMGGGGMFQQVANAMMPANSETKLIHLDNDQLKEIILKDITEYSFLTTGKITRAIYDESAMFQDEIDTYGMDQWIQGTSRLFDGEGSELRLVGDVQVTNEQVEFLFDEDLVFNVPFLKPKVHLTGKLVLGRDPNTGLITKYREYWDQDVWNVLKSAKI